ncbi:MAG TPA: aldehyde dehydrogenase family protein, partial [Ramlibacter sp.]|uniref:aldehyde dehydrogenase family protein n=1 Tax=Ramlibacter sp. TaxID=1917967 RepID=UPI002D7E9111
LAAAANLTPVTLELGGKSPAILDASADVVQAAQRIAAGKLFNAGQTCIAPDYVLLPRAARDAFVEAFTAAVRRMYPRFAGNPDYTSIVNDRHFARLQGLVREAEAAGARVLRIGEEADGAASRTFAPVLLLDPQPDLAAMREEIFGPVLPLVACDSPEEAIGFVNARPRPLALYWFGRDRAHRQQVLTRTLAGGVTVNDVLLHIAQENLPFGGVGESGIGAYHGEHGFRRFSLEKPVFEQARWSGNDLMRPPYGARAERILRLLRRLL